VSRYPIEELGPEDDNGTMPENVARLADAVVGHKIVTVEHGVEVKDATGYWGRSTATAITLDNGKRVMLAATDDCCAHTDLEKFLHHDRIDHTITGVGTTDGYDTWHIYADMGDVLELSVSWSPGNPFYYGYGFYITVEDVDG
jgi:hypothetical protein